MIRLESFIRNHVRSSIISLRFVTNRMKFASNKPKDWRIERIVYREIPKTLKEGSSRNDILDMFKDDDDLTALRDILGMPHVAAVSFEVVHGRFEVNAAVLKGLGEGFSSYYIDNETSPYHRTAPLHALRRRIEFDSFPIDEWQDTMTYRGYDVRLVRRNELFYVEAYRIDSDLGPDEYPLENETWGRTPYEALAPWRVYVTDSAASEFVEE